MPPGLLSVEACQLMRTCRSPGIRLGRVGTLGAMLSAMSWEELRPDTDRSFFPVHPSALGIVHQETVPEVGLSVRVDIPQEI